MAHKLLSNACTQNYWKLCVRNLALKLKTLMVDAVLLLALLGRLVVEWDGRTRNFEQIVLRRA
jgi:hypothetical protein